MRRHQTFHKNQALMSQFSKTPNNYKDIPKESICCFTPAFSGYDRLQEVLCAASQSGGFGNIDAVAAAF